VPECRYGDLIVTDLSSRTFMVAIEGYIHAVQTNKNKNTRFKKELFTYRAASVAGKA
jgi:hypothetical protein